MSIIAIIVAAGRGQRAQTDLVDAADMTEQQRPKQYAEINGQTVLNHAIQAFASHPAIDAVLVVIHEDDSAAYDAVALSAATGKLLPPVTGGASRQRSVLAGLIHLAHLDETSRPDKVLIHDAARPFVSKDVISSVIAALEHASGAVAAVPLTDTLQRADSHGRISETLARKGLWRAQTPQGFHYETVLAAHQRAVEGGRDDFTDDAALVSWAGSEVVVVAGSEHNRKLTTKEDMAMAANSCAHIRPRMGSGFDVHCCCEGDHVWLCGLSIPASFGLSGHSDADVALHALTDAILGALGDGDIGSHFPPSDPQWKNAASRLFLADAVARVSKAGGEIGNVDITIICESPKIAPHRMQMCAQVASILGIAVNRVSVKATTTEGLGLTGRGEGIAAMASATLFMT